MHLKGSVYVMQEPTTGAYIAMRGEQPTLTAELHLATLAPADRPECLNKLLARASVKLQGIPHELARVDAC